MTGALIGSITFREVVQIRGINPFVRVDGAVAAALRPGWRKPLPVRLRVNGKPAQPARTNLMPAGDGSFYLYLNGPVRAASEVSLGDRVQVELEFDVDYRNGPQHPMPVWFRDALKSNPAAEKNWSALAPSRKKELLRYFARLQSSDARARNMAKAIFVLSGKAGRFMGRTWTNGA